MEDEEEDEEDDDGDDDDESDTNDDELDTDMLDDRESGDEAGKLYNTYRKSKKAAKLIPLTHIHDCSLSRLGTGTSMKKY
jgi:hypothetical protein